MSRRLTEITNWPQPVGQPTPCAAQPVRVAVLDGDAAQHGHLRAHLAAREPDWQVELHTHGEPAWQALRATPPQLVLVERTLPDGCGLEWLRRCKREFPELPVVILTTQGCVKSLWAALQAGALGYWVKAAAGDEVMKELVQQMRKVLNGKLALCDQAERLLPQAFALTRQRTENQWGLSRREEEIMAALCRKLSNKDIASELGLSPATVHAHLDRIFKKLNVHNRAEAMQKFSKHISGGGKIAGRDLYQRIRPFLDHLKDCWMTERMV
jgi:DNA-binding NarL/FixJ family response regulator